MADTVDVRNVKPSGRYRTLHLQNRSDGTGESQVAKLTLSGLLTQDGKVCTYTTIYRIEYAINGMTVRLDWDHTTDDEIVTLPPGSGAFDWSATGGLTDPMSAGGPGNILLTTAGQAAGSTYDIMIYYIAKA